MTDHQTYGQTESGEPITDEMIERFAEEAERGDEPGQPQGRHRGPGRPPLGHAAKSGESVRREPALRDEVARRARIEGLTVSELMRSARAGSGRARRAGRGGWGALAGVVRPARGDPRWYRPP